MFRKPLFWVLMVAMFLAGGGEAGVTAWGPNFMEDILGESARAGETASPSRPYRKPSPRA